MGNKDALTILKSWCAKSRKNPWDSRVTGYKLSALIIFVTGFSFLSSFLALPGTRSCRRNTALVVRASWMARKEEFSNPIFRYVHMKRVGHHGNKKIPREQKKELFYRIGTARHYLLEQPFRQN